jgi:predicted dehydrogenase
MKYLIIGLGSMGKRRVRNLQALKYTNITGFDFREDRRKEAEEKYGIKTLSEVNDRTLSGVDAVIISTPPDKHLPYIKMCVQNSTPCFVEASVILKGLAEVALEAKKKNVLVAPSCTMRFHPAIIVINKLVKEKRYGKITNYVFHCGQYLPDWHPWENVKEFYVSQKETGGCREIVPYELTWLVDVVGMPKEIYAFIAKTMDFGADIDDVYQLILRYKDFLGTLVVDVTSRFAVRILTLNLEKAQIRWNSDEKAVKVYEVDTGRWVNYLDPEGNVAVGYKGSAIVEEMYIAEMQAFIGAVSGKADFPNKLEEDIKVLEILETCEQTNKGVVVK